MTTQLPQDLRQNHVGSTEHVVVPETKDTDALSGELVGASSIASGIAGFVVLTAVELDA